MCDKSFSMWGFPTHIELIACYAPVVQSENDNLSILYEEANELNVFATPFVPLGKPPPQPNPKKPKKKYWSK